MTPAASIADLTPTDDIAPAVVVDFRSVTALVVARILSRRGIPVVGLARNTNDFACKTNRLRKLVLFDSENQTLVEALIRLSDEFKRKAVLYPVTDDAVFAVSRSLDALADRYHISLPADDVVTSVLDKARFYRASLANGYPIPRTRFIRSIRDVEDFGDTLSFPCVLKPARRTPEWLAGAGAKVLKVADIEQLTGLVARLLDTSSELIVQQWIEGPDSAMHSVYAYLSRDLQPLIVGTARKIRQWPPHTGSGSSCRLVSCPEIEAITIKVCQGLGCSGLVFFQFKRDPRSGQFFIIEAHVGRPSGNMTILEASGVEMLGTVHADATGAPLPVNRTPIRSDAVWINGFYDSLAALTLMRRGALSVSEWFASLRGHRCEAVFSWRDPAPFLAMIRGAWANYAGKKQQSKEIAAKR